MCLNVIFIHPLGDNVKELFIVKELYGLHDMLFEIAIHITQLFDQVNIWDLTRQYSLILFKDYFYCNLSACALMVSFHYTALFRVLAQNFVLS